jgi:IS30 family transposase
MDYQHLTTFERGRIESLHKSGYTVREIGLQINRHHSTIARELSRNSNTKYCCKTAQEAYFCRRQASTPKGKCAATLVVDIDFPIAKNSLRSMQCEPFIHAGSRCFSISELNSSQIVVRHSILIPS